MNTNKFTFPPPPPPPPIQSYPQYTQPNSQNYEARGGGQRGGRGGAWGHGRGEGHRGSRGGLNTNPPVYGAYHSSHGGFTGPLVGGYNNSGKPHNTNNDFPPPNYPQTQEHQNRGQGQYGFGYSQQRPHATEGSPKYPPNLGGHRSAGSEAYVGQLQPHGYHDNGFHNQMSNYQAPHVPPPRAPQPMLMGPPIRMGFDGGQANALPRLQNQSHAYVQPEQNRPVSFSNKESLGPSGHPRRQPPGENRPIRNLSIFPNQGNRPYGQRRTQGDASRPQRITPERTGVTTTTSFHPAVPFYGAPLPGQPSPLSSDDIKKPKKKKRKHNQLGLTPLNEDHQSSSEDEEADEEAKLAAAHLCSAESAEQQLQFLHNGRLETLKTADDIAAWIAERKRRFPTKAKIEEAAKWKTKAEETERAAKEQRKELARKKAEAVQKQEELDMKLKIKLKTEKLKRRLEKAQRGMAKLEAITSKIKEKRAKAQLPGEENSSNAEGMIVNRSTSLDSIDKATQAVQGKQDPLTPMSRPRSPETYVSNQLQTNIGDRSSSLSSSTASDSEDDTSSDSSSSDDDAPVELPSKRKHNAKGLVTCPVKQRSTAICRNFLKHGRCNRGDSCNFRHELPARGSGTAASKEPRKKTNSKSREVLPKRLSLYQRMVLQEQEKEAEVALKQNTILREQGLLDEPNSIEHTVATDIRDSSISLEKHSSLLEACYPNLTAEQDTNLQPVVTTSFKEVTDSFAAERTEVQQSAPDRKILEQNLPSEFATDVIVVPNEAD